MQSREVFFFRIGEIIACFHAERNPVEREKLNMVDSF